MNANNWLLYGIIGAIKAYLYSNWGALLPSEYDLFIRVLKFAYNKLGKNGEEEVKIIIKETINSDFHSIR